MVKHFTYWKTVPPLMQHTYDHTRTRQRVSCTTIRGVLQPIETTSFKKILADSNNQLVLVFPRWPWCFIFSLFLSPISYILWRTRFASWSNPLATSGTRATPPLLMTKLGYSKAVEVLRILYATAMPYLYINIWYLRISLPSQYILLYKDDINLIFHRCRNHPEVTVIYA